MAGRIPKSFIDELIGRADIVEVVGARVTLKRAGSNYKGLCPFHGEKTPSFTVSPSKGFYHCFGCSAHGTAIGFLMAYDNLEFPDAVEALAEMMGLEVPRESSGAPERKDENDELYALLREADQIYRAALRSSDKAIAYLKKRGVDGPTAGRFGIGYAPDAWDTVLKQLGTSDARIEKLTQAGLLVTNDSGRRYDRFRDRIMFPIRNAPRGQIIGFGGRVLDSGEPKYLNSPETPIFRKGHELYGLYEARQNPGRPKQIIVTEGYLDVAGLVQHGIENAVATLGTATTPENLRRLTRLTDRILFCFDGDRAGRAAAWRALETALPYGGGTLELKFLLLPEGDDPDSFVRTQRSRRVPRVGGEGSAAVGLPRQRAVDAHRFRQRGRAFAVPSDREAAAEAAAGGHLSCCGHGRVRRDATSRARRARLLDVGRQGTGARPVAYRPCRRQAQDRRAEGHQPCAALPAQPRRGRRTRERLASLNQPGTDLLRRVFAAAAEIADGSTARVLEKLRDDPDFQYLERIVAEPPLAIDTEEDAAKELTASLEHLDRGRRSARPNVARIISGNKPGTGPA